MSAGAMAPAVAHPPPCRLDSGAAEAVRGLGRKVLAIYARTHSLPAREVQVNAFSGEGLSFLLVRDARAGQTDAQGCIVPDRAGAAARGSLDPWSVDEVCAAEKREIRCSANAVESLRVQGASLDASPALLFIVAHELAHVALGHPGRFGETLGVLDLGLASDEKIAVLAKLCGTKPAVLAHERAADELAQSALSEILVEPPFLEPAAGWGGSLTFSAARIRRETEALDAWGLRRVGAAAGSKISLDGGTLCALLRARTGGATLPALGGTHPQGERRVADLSARLRAAAARMGNAPLVDATHPGSAMGNFPDLARTVGDISAFLDANDANAADGASDAFCKQVYAAEAALPACP
jgi:hypothetical protein